MKNNVFRRRTGLFTVFCFLLGSVLSPLAGAAEVSDDDVMAGLSLGELLNLEVTVATKTAMTVEEAPSIVSVITGEEIQNMGARDILDVLRTIPGFDLIHPSTNSVELVSVRGMHSAQQNNKIKLMIDGHSLSVLWGSYQFQFSAVPIANIKQIEIIRGPGSALYGTGAFLGVINIITKKPEETSSMIAFEGGSHNTVKPQVSVSCQEDDFAVSLYADYYDTDGFKKTIESDAFGSGPQTAAPGDTTNGFEYSTFKADISYRDFYFTGYFQKMHEADPMVGIASALTDDDNNEATCYYGEIGYNLPITDRGDLLFKIFYDYGEQDALLEIFSEESAAAIFGWQNGETIFGYPLAENSVLGAEMTADYDVIDGIQVVGGVSYEYYKQFNSKHFATANLTGKPLEVDGVVYQPMQYLGGLVDISENGNWIQDASRSIYAAYGQSVFDIRELLSLSKGVENLSFTAGLRYDHYEDFGSTANPRFGLVYAPNEKLRFKTLYGKAFRAPNYKELYAINNPAKVGNEDLDPEEISTFEFLAGYNFTGNLKGSLTFFDVSAENLIQIYEGVFQMWAKWNHEVLKLKSGGISTGLSMYTPMRPGRM